MIEFFSIDIYKDRYIEFDGCGEKGLYNITLHQSYSEDQDFRKFTVRCHLDQLEMIHAKIGEAIKEFNKLKQSFAFGWCNEATHLSSGDEFPFVLAPQDGIRKKMNKDRKRYAPLVNPPVCCNRGFDIGEDFVYACKRCGEKF